MAGAVIWALSPSMSKEVKGKERQPGRYVFNNTQLPISVRESAVYPNPPHPHCTIPARPGHQVELKIHGHPLYTSICILSEAALAYEMYRKRRAIDGFTLAGPQTQPDYWTVYQWKTQSPVPDVGFQPQSSDICGLRPKLTGVPTSLYCCRNCHCDTCFFCIEGPGGSSLYLLTPAKTFRHEKRDLEIGATGLLRTNFRIKTQQGGMYLPIISCIWKILKIDFGCPPPIYSMGVVAVGTHSSPDSPPPGTDSKDAGVNHYCRRQHSNIVTTKSVTCQSSAGMMKSSTSLLRWRS
ncbi:hypothetical protein CRENBAI_011255 [Crenichthys baileyi]|uniref:Uncharacterized protein n=1 Tax=Crenichthys baileyi TaxID=28760 RepID=A0AAV9R6T6_9TELE